jgi:hypothetical protein
MHFNTEKVWEAKKKKKTTPPQWQNNQVQVIQASPQAWSQAVQVPRHSIIKYSQL